MLLFSFVSSASYMPSSTLDDIKRIAGSSSGKIPILVHLMEISLKISKVKNSHPPPLSFLPLWIFFFFFLLQKRNLPWFLQDLFCRIIKDTFKIFFFPQRISFFFLILFFKDTFFFFSLQIFNFMIIFQNYICWTQLKMFDHFLLKKIINLNRKRIFKTILVLSFKNIIWFLIFL